jgi:hypothetical protein
MRLALLLVAAACAQAQTQVDWISQVKNKPVVDSRQYNFTPQKPGGSLGVGTNSITMRPCYANGTDTNHYLYISGGAGTAEAVLITGGTCTMGAAVGTVNVVVPHTHSGAWTIQSATAGISEAIWSLSSAGGQVQLPTGTLTIHASVKRRLNMAIWIEGGGQEATTLAVASDFPLNVKGVFDWSPLDSPSTPVKDSGGISGFTVQFVQPDTTVVANYTHWPPAFYSSGAVYPIVENVDIYAAWDGIKLDAVGGNNNGAGYRNVRASWFHTAFDLDGSLDTVRIEKFQGSTFGLTSNQTTAFASPTAAEIAFHIGRIDDVKIINCTIFPAFGDFHTGADGSAAQAEITGLWADQGGYRQSDGIVQISNSFIGGNLTAQQSIVFTGGQLYITNTRISNSVGFPCVYAVVTAGVAAVPTTYPPFLSVQDSYITTLNSDVQAVIATTATPYAGVFNLALANNFIARYPGIAYAVETINIANGTGDTRLKAIGNIFGLRGGGSGKAILLADDTWHEVTGNQGDGYTFGIAGTTKTQWHGNVNFASNVNYLLDATRIKGKLSPSSIASLQTENWIGTETGANNAIAGTLLDAAGVAVPLAAGVKFTVLLAHTLQAGANTVNINSLGAKNLKSSRNPANNIATGYAAGGILSCIYDGTSVLDLSQ